MKAGCCNCVPAVSGTEADADSIIDRARTAPHGPSPVRITHTEDGGTMENIG